MSDLTVGLLFYVAVSGYAAMVMFGSEWLIAPGRRPITKALYVVCFALGAIPYALGALLAWSVRRTEP